MPVTTISEPGILRVSGRSPGRGAHLARKNRDCRFAPDPFLFTKAKDTHEEDTAFWKVAVRLGTFRTRYRLLEEASPK